MSNVKVLVATAVLFAASASSARAAEASSEGPGFPEAHNFSYTHALGPDEDARVGASPAGSDQYLFVAGSAFSPRTSTQTVSYPGAGCIFSDSAVTTDVQLPSGTEVLGVRLYYYDMATLGNVNIFFTNYDGAGDGSDLISGSSTLESGFSSEFFSAPASVFIDNASGSYVLIANMATGLRFCGARLFISQP
jgi:hypothetical protein